MALNRSLTVLLPVRDAQSTLAATVTEILEMASDLSERFELLIIDDGSSDATSEVARELSRHYPQIRTVRHASRWARKPPCERACAQSRGDVVVVRGQRPTFERLAGAASRCVPITWAVRGPSPARGYRIASPAVCRFRS